MTTYTAFVSDDLTGTTESVHTSASAAYNSLVDYAHDNNRQLVPNEGVTYEGTFTEQDEALGRWRIVRTPEPLTLVDTEAPLYRTTVDFDEDEVRISNTWGDLDEPDTHVAVTISRTDAARLIAHLAAMLA